MSGVRHQRLAGAHPVAVALHRVDLAVVGEVAVRVRERPRRERVGREAAVHQRERRLDALVGEVGEELGELRRGEHALVDEGAARQRREVDAAPSTPRRSRARSACARTNSLRSSSMPVRAVGVVDEAAAGSSGMTLSAVGPIIESSIGHVAPAEDPQALLRHDRLDRGPSVFSAVGRGRAGRNARPDAVGARGRQRRSRRRPRRKRSGTCSRMPAPSPVLTSAPDAPAVVEVAERAERVATMSRLARALDVDDERDAAGVVLEARVVEARTARGAR